MGAFLPPPSNISCDSVIAWFVLEGTQHLKWMCLGFNLVEGEGEGAPDTFIQLAQELMLTFAF